MLLGKHSLETIFEERVAANVGRAPVRRKKRRQDSSTRLCGSNRSTSHPGLAPWAAFLRRSAAMTGAVRFRTNGSTGAHGGPERLWDGQA